MPAGAGNDDVPAAVGADDAPVAAGNDVRGPGGAPIAGVSSGSSWGASAGAPGRSLSIGCLFSHFPSCTGAVSGVGGARPQLRMATKRQVGMRCKWLRRVAARKGEQPRSAPELLEVSSARRAVDRGSRAARDTTPTQQRSVGAQDVGLELALRAGYLQRKGGLAVAGLGVDVAEDLRLTSGRR